MSPLERDLGTDERWTFDADVAANFGEMLERSIPQLSLVRDLVVEIGSEFVQPGTAIVDLGTSRGDMLDPFVRRFGAYNQFVGVECSAPMLAFARERFADWISLGYVDVVDLDLRRDYPHRPASLTIAFLTLQFVPIEHRARVVDRAYDRTVRDGALIVVEKVLGGSSRTDDVLVEHYRRHKRRAGYSEEEIDRKALSLEGVLVASTVDANEQMLRSAGFDVEGFWRFLNFCGWLAVKR